MFASDGDGEEKYGSGGWFNPKPRVKESNPPKSDNEERIEKPLRSMRRSEACCTPSSSGFAFIANYRMINLP